MKCVDCPDYKACRRQNDLRRKRHKCKKANEPFVQTNAERIRAMSDEELADMQTMLTGSFTCHECTRNNAGRCNAECVKNCLDWLRQPVKDGDNDGE